jgi:hypothetical protein
LYNLYSTDIGFRTLKGVPQKKWGTLFTLFTKYGQFPRLLFATFLQPDKYDTKDAEESLQERISEYDSCLKGKIERLLKTDPQIARSTAQYGVNSSPIIFMIRPRKCLLWYKYVSTRSVVDIATPHIGHRIGEARTDTGLLGACTIYRLHVGDAETMPSAGWIFEARMPLVFQRGGCFEASQLGGAKTFTIKIDKPCRRFGKVSELGSLLQLQPQSRSIDAKIIGVYFRPHQCNLASVDSFVIAKSRTTRKPMLVLFQFTVGGSPPLKAHELESIWEQMPARIKETPPILVFVVPDQVASGFSRQTVTPSGSNASSPFQEWDQYVAAISIETLWEQ